MTTPKSPKTAPIKTTPTILQGGFRIMFFMAALWAAYVMIAWISFWAAGTELPSGAMLPQDWHMHSILYGFAPAVLGGFLLTAIPNWTDTKMITGTPLALLAVLWALGRVAVWLSGGLPLVVVILLDIAFLLALLIISARILLKSGNQKNMPVLAIILLFLMGQVFFDVISLAGGYASVSPGAKLSVGAIILLLSLIGGRIIPAFTRNWLIKHSAENLPIMFNGLDKVTVGISAVSLLTWVVAMPNLITGFLFLTAGILHIIRMSRWQGQKTASVPIVMALHIAYSFVPLGFLLQGLSMISPETVPSLAGLHAWLSGAMGGMMLAVMTRASLGHSGRELHTTWREVFIYGMILIASVVRVIAAFPTPEFLLHIAATAWIMAFAGFAVLYAPVLFSKAKE
ncbi:NnrS family protein [Halocynthiibacter namhaensis]|uniref:NnrS family protein n=1 Tax=Halocynthiibacter namhaensis TaxID=1290553 RepID=UPI0006902249|nr:NnrS family protein [Halocynthiibacter namhaensis]